MQLSHAKAVISGGASGLGLAVAKHLKAEGAEVCLLDLNDDEGQSQAKALGAAFYRVDVSSEADIAAAVAEAKATMGGLNAAIACAGVLGAGRMLGREQPMPLAQFARTIDINLVGTFNLCKAAAAAMTSNDPNADGERGVLVNTASVAAYEGQIGQAAYAASKGGVVGMTLPMARELTRFGIRVLTIAPGVFHTPMVDGMPEKVYESLCAQVPFPSRLGKPEEFASLVAYTLTNSYLNGETIRLDGAIRMQPK